MKKLIPHFCFKKFAFLTFFVYLCKRLKTLIMIIEYAEDRLGFKPKKDWLGRNVNKGIDLANEFCEWARKSGREDLIVDLTREIGFH